MEDLSTSIILQAIGMVLLVFEIFIPSHGLLTVGGLGCLGTGIWFAFGISDPAGYVSLALAIILVPTMAIFAVRIWHRTPLGKRISPPNPVLTAADRATLRHDLNALVGKTGRSVTLLRPVGACEFEGSRIECVAEMGTIEAGQSVRAVRVDGRELVVRLTDTETGQSA